MECKQHPQKPKKSYQPAEIKLIPVESADLLTISGDQGEWTPFVEDYDSPIQYFLS